MDATPYRPTCTQCFHECHCDENCKTYIGIGMSDKSVPCNCKTCKCQKENKNNAG